MLPTPFSEGPLFGLLILLATSGLTLLHLVVVLVVGAARRLQRRRAARTLHPIEVAPPAPTLAFVVAVYNDGLTIGPCVESILAQSRPADQVIVVDDASTDRTPEVLAGFRERGVEVIRMARNGGKTRALEEALRHVTCELVAITDADSLVHRDYVKEITTSFRDPEVVGVGGAVESIPHTWVTASRQVEYLLTLKVDRAAEDAMDALIVLPGVSSTYRTSVLLEMGFEHDTIAEDFDLTFRLQRAGRKLGMNPRALVYTSDPPTLKAYARQLDRWYTDLWITVRKHKGVVGQRVFGTVEVPWLVVNMLAYSVFVVAFPLFLLAVAPPRFLTFVASELATDAALSILAAIAYRRADVLWGILSRAPTRYIARWITLTTFARVAVGRPGMAWTKLERRRTDAFLALKSRAPTSRASTPESP